jgi:hypothetical protein
MFRKTVGWDTLLLVILVSTTLLAQQTPEAAKTSQGTEFPVIMRQNVAAGKTPVGTKVEAKLVVATLVNGVVVPREATLSGEVTESVAKSATDPSRLAVRMDSAQWKDKSVPVKLYLTAWYYPVATMTAQDLSYQPPDAARSPKNWNGAGTYPDPNNPASQPFPGRDADKDSSAASSPSTTISKHRVLMKDVESTRQSDGAVVLVSKRSNVKLDKVTTYVLASDELIPRN